MNHPMTGAIERAARLHAKDVRARLFGAGRPEPKAARPRRAAPIAVPFRPKPEQRSAAFAIRVNRPLSSIAKEIIAQEMETAGIGSADFFSRTRKIHITRARQISAYRIHQHTNLSMPLIAKALGYVDHTTVLHAIRKIALEVSRRDSMANGVETLKRLSESGADPDAIISKGYALGVPVKDISRISGKSVKAVVGRAYRIGLRHTAALDPHELRRRISDGQKAAWAARKRSHAS